MGTGMQGRRFRRIGSVAIGLAVVAGAVFSAPLRAETVRVGTTRAITDTPLYIGIAKGYFKEQGLDVKLMPFNGASQMVAPMGAGQLDVGAGANSAALYNAYSHGVGIKVVADKGSTPKGYGFQALTVRKDLVDSGKFKTFKDLKGMRIGVTGVGNALVSSVELLLEKGGLTLKDVSIVNLNFPEHVTALANKAIDASMATEPTVTLILHKGLGVKEARDDEFNPGHQIAVLIYGSEFIKNRPETAKKFMVGYLKSVRFYNDALKNGHLAGPNAAEVIRIMSESTPVKDPSVYRDMAPMASNPDGRVNIDSLKRDYAFYKREKLLTGKATVEDLVDHSFADAAIKVLGPYKPKR